MGNTITSLASTLTQSVNEVQKGIVETQQQLASGKATLNAAETGVVSRMTAQVAGYGSVTKNLTDAGSAIDVAQSALTSISTIMSQLKGLATQASSAGFASTDRDSLNLTFQNLTNQIQQLVTSASVNGANLLNTDFGLQITTGIDGTPDSQTQINATNVGDLVKSLNQLLITGMQIKDQTFSTVNLSQPTSAPVPGTGPTLTVVNSNITTPAQPTITFPPNGLKAGDSFSLTSGGSTIKLTVTSDMTGTQLATAFLNKIQNAASPATDSYGVWSGAGTFSGTGAGTTTLTRGSCSATDNVLTLVYSGAQLAASQVGSISSGPQTQVITLPTVAMSQGNTITIGNVTFTAGPGPGTTALGISPSQVSAAFVNYINNGVQPDPGIGVFSTTTNAQARVDNLTFHDLTTGQYFLAGGLKFYANTNVTAAQVANAFLHRISNENATFTYGCFGASATSPAAPGTLNNTITTGLSTTAVSAGGSTTTIAWSYSPAGVAPTDLLSSATFTVAGNINNATVSIAKNGINANTGTKITGGIAFNNHADILSSNTISLRTGEPLTTVSTPAIAGATGTSLLSSVGNAYRRNTLTFTNTNLLTGTANLFPGDSVTINGLTFTASQTATPQQVLDAFKNVINNADTGNLYGTFSNTDVGSTNLPAKVSEFTSYFKAIDLGNNVLAIDNTAINDSTTPLEIKWNTQNAAIANANKATQVITGQIDTISTAQASLAAATAGIQAQLKNATNIKNGMQKTIDAIANIDPTALQANLQQLNTQQSVDYYLVSQMNTAAAAIL
jgi:flagellin-like hook-associated protein FlgL